MFMTTRVFCVREWRNSFITIIFTLLKLFSITKYENNFLKTIDIITG